MTHITRTRAGQRVGCATLVATVAAIALAACGSGDDAAESNPTTAPSVARTPLSTQAPAEAAAPTTPAPPTTEAPATQAPTTEPPPTTEPAPTTEPPPTTEAPAEADILGWGFARSGGDYIRAIVLVKANSESVIGEFASVSVNFLDASGAIVSTEDQVEGFNWVGQELAFPFLLEDTEQSVVSMDPWVTFTDYGGGGASRPPLPVLDATEITEARYGGYEASFGYTNETEEDLASIRVGVVCYDVAGTIIGGTSTYPDAAAGRTVRIDADVDTATMPASCKAFLNYP